jgi:hypothetical protein
MATNSTNFDPHTLATFQGYTVRSELSSPDHLSPQFNQLIDRRLPSHLVLLRQFILLVATGFETWMQRLKEICHLQLLISHIGTVRDHIGDYCACWLIKIDPVWASASCQETDCEDLRLVTVCKSPSESFPVVPPLVLNVVSCTITLSCSSSTL